MHTFETPFSFVNCIVFDQCIIFSNIDLFIMFLKVNTIFIAFYKYTSHLEMKTSL